MKWTLDQSKKLKNYKGEVFPGKVNRDFDIGDQYETEVELGKKVLLEVKDKRETSDFLVVESVGVSVNG